MKLDYAKGLLRLLISLVLLVLWTLVATEKMKINPTTNTVLNITFLIIIIYWFLDGIIKNVGITKLLESIAESKLIKKI